MVVEQWYGNRAIGCMGIDEQGLAINDGVLVDLRKLRFCINF